VASASQSAPTRRRTPKKAASAISEYLVTFDALPHHLKDNKFILRGYRSQFTPGKSLRSLFRLHNETGNVWTHLVGVVIFICLTVFTIYLRPAPLVLGSDALHKLEGLFEEGRYNMLELVKEVGAWERGVLKVGWLAGAYCARWHPLSAPALRTAQHHEHPVTTTQLAHAKENLPQPSSKLPPLSTAPLSQLPPCSMEPKSCMPLRTGSVL
jgi:hypothetical protein